MLYWRAPNTEKLEQQFLQTMQVGGAPTQKLAESQLTIMCELAGPQHKEFRKEIQQAMQVGGAPTQRISKRNSTGSASWGGTEINFAKISFLSYSLYHFCSNPVMLKF